VKDKKKVLSGFGHRVYKNYDPRAKIVKKVLSNLFRLHSKFSKFAENNHLYKLLFNFKELLFPINICISLHI